ncbi:MAG: MmgE/PrpD family protein [Pseudomonadota bacterium]
MTRNQNEHDLTQELAGYASSIQMDEVPEVVLRQARLCILDTLGCIVAGSRVDDWKPLMTAESAVSERQEATVIGTGKRLPAEAAARVNAYMGDIFELNDLIGGHASIGNVSALLALAEAIGATGRQLVEAVVVGLEVTARIYYGYYPAMKPYDEVGMNPVVFPSSYGVAAGAARLMGLTQAQLGHAMGIAGTLAGWCPAEVVFGDGGTVKPMLFGACPATSGLTGARYAQAGMTGPQRLLEGPRGYFVTAARAMFPDAVRDRDTWHVAAPRRKYHAACGYIHSPVDVVVAMRHEGVDFSRARELRVGVAELTIPGVSKSRPPTTGNEARFHLEYCVAVAALGEDVILPEHSIEFETYLAKPEVRAMLEKVRVVADPAQKHYHHCAVTLIDGQGHELLRREGRGPKGSPQNPMTDEEVLGKFRRLVAHRLSGDALDQYLEKALQLERHQKWDWLVGAFA